MPQLLPSLRPHAPDVAGQPDHLGFTGESEQGANICYQSQRKQKGHILAPQSLTCGQKKVLWFRVSGSEQRPESEGWRKGQELSTPPIFSLWVWMNRGRRRRKRTCPVKRVSENSALERRPQLGAARRKVAQEPIMFSPNCILPPECSKHVSTALGTDLQRFSRI